MGTTPRTSGRSIASPRQVRALVPTAGHASFLQAMVRDRVVADDWLVSIDGNRYSVPFSFIGKTVQVVCHGGPWVMRHRGAVVAEHVVLAAASRACVPSTAPVRPRATRVTATARRGLRR